jgi:hypothetical protein
MIERLAREDTEPPSSVFSSAIAPSLASALTATPALPAFFIFQKTPTLKKTKSERPPCFASA